MSNCACQFANKPAARRGVNYVDKASRDGPTRRTRLEIVSFIRFLSVYCRRAKSINSQMRPLVSSLMLSKFCKIVCSSWTSWVWQVVIGLKLQVTARIAQIRAQLAEQPSLRWLEHTYYGDCIGPACGIHLTTWHAFYVLAADTLPASHLAALLSIQITIFIACEFF